VVGSFFEQSLPQADAVMMGHILHDWDLPTKRLLIHKAFDALPDGGALIVYESRGRFHAHPCRSARRA
jgi:hypothetical protein